MTLDSKNKKIVHAHIDRSHYKVEMNAGGHQLFGDEPEGSGGSDAGPDPYDYLLMSLGSCTAMTVRMYADHKEWPVEEVFVELLHHKVHAEDCENCDKKTSKVDHIEKDVIIVGDLTEKQKDRLLEVSERCPVHRTLQSDIEITSQLSHKESV